MKEHDYFQIFQKLGFEVKPLPENYDPDTYGRTLMMENDKNSDVSYSSSTDYVYTN